MSENNLPDKPKYPRWLIYAMLLLALVLWQHPWSLNDQTDPVNTGTPTEQVQKAKNPVDPAYSEFLQDVKDGKIAQVTILSDGSMGLIVVPKGADAKPYKTYYGGDPGLMKILTDQPDLKVIVKAPPPPPSFIEGFFTPGTLVMIVFVGMIGYFYFGKKGGMGGAGGAQEFGKAKGAIVDDTDKIKETFASVAGCDDAKESIWEMTESLLDPSLFTEAGGEIPHGILLLGPPGTGKTLIARAVAGEINAKFKELKKNDKEAAKKITFFSISGSNFVEMFVGVGASRVRDLFKQAKEKAPCIIFIDEFDAVGRQRGGNVGNNNDEREQTLNQILVEMDGFDGLEGVIVMAATNRPDVLDKGVMRPGRFDRQITLNNPDMLGRVEVFKVHTRNKKLDSDVVLLDLARGTTGMSCAHIANICNEAALIAAREKRTVVTMTDLEKAKDKVLLGPENKTMVMNDEEKWLTAAHEAGHAIVGRLSKNHPPVYKVSITPRGGALGLTFFLPERDEYSASKEKLHSQIRSLYGGRVAEVMRVGEDGVTTGASNDIMRATDLAKRLVVAWGLSKLGVRSFVEEGNGPQFLGGSGTFQSQTSQAKAKAIDDEIDFIIDKIYKEAEEMLHAHDAELTVMTEALLKWETIGVPQIDAVMEGKTMESGEIPVPVGFVEKPAVTPVIEKDLHEGKQE
ncbi:MAG: ATP-dependent zinc metalloprotease FtsH [Candidatus Paceibacterota bacterium]|jgi:cell division protease FtsH|nr:ATP-dependent zinc metalloprotease FtsH [Candidatus Paceibacterota bacterium]